MIKYIFQEVIKTARASRNKCYLCHHRLAAGEGETQLCEDEQLHKVCKDKASCQARQHHNMMAQRRGATRNNKPLDGADIKRAAESISTKPAKKCMTVEEQETAFTDNVLADQSLHDEEDLQKAALDYFAEQEKERMRILAKAAAGMLATFAALWVLLAILKYFLKV